MSPDPLADPPKNIPVPMASADDEDLTEDESDSESEMNDGVEISHLYDYVENLGKSTLSSDCQDQMRNLSYGSIMLSVHQDIEM